MKKMKKIIFLLLFLVALYHTARDAVALPAVAYSYKIQMLLLTTTNAPDFDCQTTIRKKVAAKFYNHSYWCKQPYTQGVNMRRRQFVGNCIARFEAPSLVLKKNLSNEKTRFS